MDDSTIMPGSPVRTSDGDFGAVEGVETDSGGVVLTELVIRQEPAGARYRVPASRVESVRRHHGQDVVQVAGTAADLEPYRIHETLAGNDAAEESMAHHQGGLLERLQAGIGSLTSSMRGARPEHTHGEDETGEALRVPVVEEEIVTRTEMVRTGTLRVRKTVETGEETVTVSVSHEEPDVAYVAVEDYDPKAPYLPGETYIPIMGEKLVVERRQVVTGYLRIRKRIVSEERHVTESVRRERVTVEEESADGD